MTLVVDFFTDQGFVGQGKLPPDFGNQYLRPNSSEFCCVVRDHLTVTMESVLSTFILIKYRFASREANVTGFIEHTVNTNGIVILASNSGKNLQTLDEALASVIRLRAQSFWYSPKRPDYIGGYARD
ncbi:MAG: hypothetical protein EOP83_03950 [Verrucomicrobiaceae bacterium]|nr:MAG: hypothetical protein EOP83_03950 [Verrucomicrobiaceae bacterium]